MAIVTANRQLQALNKVLRQIGRPASTVAGLNSDPAKGAVAASPGMLKRLGKNTIVRGVLQALTNQQ